MEFRWECIFINVEAKGSTNKKITTHWRLRWCLEFFLARKHLQLRYIHCVFRHNAVAHWIEPSSIPTTWICTEKNKNFVACFIAILSLLWWPEATFTIPLRHVIVGLPPCGLEMLAASGHKASSSIFQDRKGMVRATSELFSSFFFMEVTLTLRFFHILNCMGQTCSLPSEYCRRANPRPSNKGVRFGFSLNINNNFFKKAIGDSYGRWSGIKPAAYSAKCPTCILLPDAHGTSLRRSGCSQVLPMGYDAL